MANEVDPPVKTFAISLREKADDESAYAAAVAHKFSTEQYTLVVSVDLIAYNDSKQEDLCP